MVYERTPMVRGDLRRLSPETRVILHCGLESGHATYGKFSMERRDFYRLMIERCHERVARRGLPVTPDRLAAALASCHAADLYLAAACDAKEPTAWDVFDTQWRGPGRDVLVAGGVEAPQARAMLEELLERDTPFARYDGSAPLVSWLVASVLWTLQARRAPDPPRRVEAGSRDSRARVAWDRLTSQETQAFLLRKQQRLDEETIGWLMRLPRTNVRRLLDEALGTIRREAHREEPSRNPTPLGGRETPSPRPHAHQRRTRGLARVILHGEASHPSPSLTGKCPDPAQLAVYVTASRLPGEREALERHLPRCPRCVSIVGGLARGHTRLWKDRAPVPAKPRRGAWRRSWPWLLLATLGGVAAAL